MLGRRDDALKVIERLLHHKADLTQARLAAELYLAKSTASDGMLALSKLQICFQANPRDLDTLGLLARAFTQIGQAGKAIGCRRRWRASRAIRARWTCSTSSSRSS